MVKQNSDIFDMQQAGLKQNGMAQAVPVMLKKRQRKTVYFQPNKRALALDEFSNDVDMIEQPSGSMTQRHSTAGSEQFNQQTRKRPQQTVQRKNSHVEEITKTEASQLRPWTAK